MTKAKEDSTIVENGWPFRSEWSFDIELLGDDENGYLFQIGFENMGTGEQYLFEYKRMDGKDRVTNTAKTQMTKFWRQFTKEDLVFGHNIFNYDLPLLALWEESGYEPTFEDLQDRSNQIVLENKSMWKVMREFDYPFTAIDTMEIGNMKKSESVAGTAMTRFVGLKEAAANLGHTNIMDFAFDPYKSVTPEIRKECTFYLMKRDLPATNCVANFLMDDVKSRLRINDMFNVDVTSLSEPKTGKKVLVELYKRKYGQNPYVLAERRWGKDKGAALGDFFFNHNKNLPPVEHYKFFSEEAQQAHDTMRAYKGHYFAKGEARYHDTLKFKTGLIYTLGEGGLHSDMPPNIWGSDDDHTIYQVDASAFYPVTTLNREYFPRHLPGYGPLYESIVDMRLNPVTGSKAEKRKKDDGVLKIIINSTGFGMLLDKYSPFLDPDMGRGITTSGQLYLITLTDWYLARDIEVLAANTDGIFVRVHKTQEEKFRKITACFEKNYKFKMDLDELGKFVMRNANSYLLIDKQGEVVKGAKEFNPKVSPIRVPSGRIMGKAAVEYYTKGIPVERTIRECTDIRDFVFVKAHGKKATSFMKFDFSPTEIVMPSTQRYIVSTGGGYVRKETQAGKNFKFMKETKLFPCFDFHSLDARDYPINYDFYIDKCKKDLIIDV